MWWLVGGVAAAVVIGVLWYGTRQMVRAFNADP